MHLQDAIRINYFGPLKMLALAHDCLHLQSFTYISTAYVNSDRRHYVEEKIYDMPQKQDIDQLMWQLIQLDPEFVSENESSLIG